MLTSESLREVHCSFNQDILDFGLRLLELLICLAISREDGFTTEPNYLNGVYRCLNLGYILDGWNSTGPICTNIVDLTICDEMTLSLYLRVLLWCSARANVRFRSP